MTHDLVRETSSADPHLTSFHDVGDTADDTIPPPPKLQALVDARRRRGQPIPALWLELLQLHGQAGTTNPNGSESSRNGLVRIATWNVERVKPNGWKIAPRQRQRMSDIDADVWVLTETRIGYAPSTDHQFAVYSPEHPGRRPSEERWASVWSRWPLRRIENPAPHRRGTVAAIVEHPETPFIVYGAVIAWANERHFDNGRPAGMWRVHLAEIERQRGDWERIRQLYPDLPLIVAGHFNQDRDGSGWYGTNAARASLTEALRTADLRCVTDSDVVRRGLLAKDHLVDHLCLSNGSAIMTVLRCVERMDADGVRLSDHPTVIVDIAFR